MIPIYSRDELKDLLASAGIDTSQWGVQQAKTIEDLWQELVKGETQIQIEPLLRVVEVVRVIIRKGSHVLTEARQELRDGRIRLRNGPPAEKMKANESHLSASMRCLREELGVGSKDITILGSSCRKEQKIMESSSYPGLNTLYVFHEVEVSLNNLPDEDFSTDEASGNENDPVGRHYWVWKTWPATEADKK